MNNCPAPIEPTEVQGKGCQTGSKKQGPRVMQRSLCKGFGTGQFCAGSAHLVVSVHTTVLVRNPRWQFGEILITLTIL